MSGIEQTDTVEKTNDAKQCFEMHDHSEIEKSGIQNMQLHNNCIDSMKPIGVEGTSDSISNHSQLEGKSLNEMSEDIYDEGNENDEIGSYSSSINRFINSKEELAIYEKAELEERNVESRICLIRNDIDINQKDDFGMTNEERMHDGHPPISADGQTIELHHIGQKMDSPLAELTMQEHRGKGNDAILHDKAINSEIDRTEFTKEREHYWQSRANTINGDEKNVQFV